MTECPFCFRDTVDTTGKCTRCGVQLPKNHSTEPRIIDTRAPVQHRYRDEAWEQDYSRTREDKK